MPSTSTWWAIFAVIAIVVVLSAFGVTKKVAYWIGGLVLLALLLLAFKGGKTQ